MKSNEIRQKFLKFFEKRGHSIIPSASLVPANDPSVLFTTAGMQPLVPYLLGQPHPAGKRIVNIQKCVRTGDLEEVGDNRHLSFFEMLGNWSLGDYFKKEAITWSFEFLTSKEEGLGLDLSRLYFTCFEGDENAPQDTETAEIWKSLGVSENHIFFLGAEDNWWSPGENGPCGPDSEMFYDFVGDFDVSKSKNPKEDFVQAVKDESIIEIWNDVFMEYEKKDGKVIGKLSTKNVDTGAGLERITALMQGKRTAYDTDLFLPIIEKINEISKYEIGGNNSNSEINAREVNGNLSETNLRSARIIADHIRTSVMLISDGVRPDNKDQGYVLRRLLRRAMIKMKTLAPDYYSARNNQKIEEENSKMKYQSIFSEIIEIIYGIYSSTGYLKLSQKETEEIILNEENKFRLTLDQGIKEYQNMIKTQRNITGEEAFTLYSTYGLPIDSIVEFGRENGGPAFEIIEIEGFYDSLKKHQELSRAGGEQKFKGGLANTNEETIKLHTAHHLLLSALRKVLGPTVKQRGSNITEERLRLDFSFDRKMTDEEKTKAENLVNEAIKSNYKVTYKEMSRVDAEKIGAEMEFGAKYGETVSVYIIEDENGNAFSKEFCGGPHVANTGELGQFKILKEEASSQGVRRIKATLK